jgi:hypothetical protein
MERNAPFIPFDEALLEALTVSEDLWRLRRLARGIRWYPAFSHINDLNHK